MTLTISNINMSWRISDILFCFIASRGGSDSIKSCVHQGLVANLCWLFLVLS